MLKRKLLAFAAVLCLALPSFGFEVADIEFADCTVAPPAAADCSAFIGTGAGQAKNVILMVGDGMGLTQVFAGRVKVNGPDKPLAWEQLPHRGLATTCSLTGITDSAASSTALHSGHKTENGRINTGPDNQRLENITDLIHARRAVGVVSTVRIWDATPAGATAHASLRSQDREIAAEMVRQTRPEVILGGGAAAFLPVSSLRAKTDLDRADLLAEARAAGYTVVRTNDELEALDLNATNRLVGLFAGGDMTWEALRLPGSKEPHLSEMSAAALDVLDNDPRGFYLMIEGGAIDHACHGTSIGGATAEVVEFDRAIAVVLKWMETHPDTLLIVTADHETGGMELIPGAYKQGDTIKVKWRKSVIPGVASHSDQKVAVYAVGPNADAVKPQMHNSDIFCLIRNAFGEN